MNQNETLIQMLQKMKFSTTVVTILGLFTVGGYWILFLKKWLDKNRAYKQSFYVSRLEESVRKPFLDRLQTRTDRNLKLANITGILLAIGLVLFIVETFAELYLRKILFDEEPFWFFVWLVFSLFAVLLAAIALQLKQTMEEEEKLLINSKKNVPWLLKGDKTKIYILVFLNIICALGLLPFVVFPPILGSALNGYVEQEISLHSNNGLKL